ncbi:MAG: PQQ-binding-like beta-propeller repeat protein [Gammaproteobacteria bacterium]|nr:PQQ-binding-like beta-propeller repeat protein [Gammaproteobacteria bacterium]
MKYLCLPVVTLIALLSTAAVRSADSVDGAKVFADTCASCHVQLQDEKIPRLDALRQMNANAVLRTLTEGAMRLQGDLLTAQQRVAVAEFVSADKVVEQPLAFERGMCESLPAVRSFRAVEVWSGWGRDPANTRFATDGGISRDNLSRLKLKWAFGIPGVVSARSQPAVYGDRLFVGSVEGMIFALNANTGCSYWSFKTEGGVRSALSVAEIQTSAGVVTAVFASDLRAYAYAINAETGALLWKVKVDTHQAAMGTAAPKYHDGRLYVPLAGLSEEGLAGGVSDYQCCSFRGSVTALNAATGEQIWQTFTLPPSAYVRTFSDGKTLNGPAGVAVWNTPTVDTRRGLLYFATGNQYVEPPMPTANAVVAVDIDTGVVRWSTQTLAQDIWSGGCSPDFGGDPKSERCWDPVGPDLDFSASPVLVTRADGKDVIIATQKSGLGYAFDPDDNGKMLWQYRWGVGAAPGGVYGTASDGRYAYFAVADQRTPHPGGLHAVDITTGRRAWFTPPAELLCKAGPGCGPAMSAAVTVIPGAVLAGSMDGGLRAYDADSGAVLWTYDTNRSFDTVNGVRANGGSLDGAGPVIVNGMMYITASNGGPFGTPGNALLAFSLE